MEHIENIARESRMNWFNKYLGNNASIELGSKEGKRRSKTLILGGEAIRIALEDKEIGRQLRFIIFYSTCILGFSCFSVEKKGLASLI